MFLIFKVTSKMLLSSTTSTEGLQPFFRKMP